MTKSGVAMRLHELEHEIMDVVWSQRWTEFSVGDVLCVLQRRREIAYTTVMTTVARLHDKGILERRRDGKRYLYSPRYGRTELLEETARAVLKGLGREAGREALALLVDTASRADAAGLDELERVIERRRRELRR